MIRRRFALVLAMMVTATPAVAGTMVAADVADSLAIARELYAGAAYDDALALLNRLRAGAHAPEEGGVIEQYRAFCLLALGRSADAEQAIVAIVTTQPLYRPNEADLSPRVRAVFSDVRRKVLPSIVQERYAAAKSAYDRKEFAAAADLFGQLLTIMGDPDLEVAASRPPLADLRLLAGGFRDLSVTAAAPPPPPPPPPPPLPPSQERAPVALTPEPPVPFGLPPRPRVYGPEDVDVVPPVVIRQALPIFQLPAGAAPPSGAMEVIVDERGGVQSATMRTSISPRWDKSALEAVKSWRYEPATLNGVPVKYRRTVKITVTR